MPSPWRARATSDGTLRTASGHVHPDGAPPPGYRTAARRACRPGGDARAARPTWCISAAARFAIADAARWAARPRFSRWCGRTTAGFAPRMEQAVPYSEVACAGPAGTRLSRDRRSARTSTAPESAVGFSVAAVALAGGAFQPDRTSRVSAPVTAARRWAACSGSRWSRGASSRTASAPTR